MNRHQPARIEHKRGDTFRYVGKMPEGIDLTGAVPLCQIRTAGGVLIDTVDAQLLPGGVLELFCRDTSAWRVCDAELDVRFTLNSGDVISTNAISIVITRDVSRA